MVTWGINYMQFVGCLSHITMDLTSISENKKKKKKIIELTTAVQILVIWAYLDHQRLRVPS